MSIVIIALFIGVYFASVPFLPKENPKHDRTILIVSLLLVLVICLLEVQHIAVPSPLLLLDSLMQKLHLNYP